MQIALGEMVRFILGELLYAKEPAEFQRRQQLCETSIVNDLTSSRLWPGADEDTEAYFREAATGYVTRMIALIRHPSE